VELKKKVIISVVCLILVAGIAAGGLFWLSRQKYEVTFCTEDGTVLLIDTVTRNHAATPPVEPQVAYGTVFSCWDKDFSKIREDITVTAVCENIQGKTNVFALSSAYGKKGDSVFVPFQLCGDVCTAGFSLTVAYDADCVAIESAYDEDGGVIINTDKVGEIKLNYVSTENTVGDVDLCGLRFKVLKDFESTPLTVTVEKAVAVGEKDTLNAVDSTVINAYVYCIAE